MVLTNPQQLILNAYKHGFRDTLQPQHRDKHGATVYATWPCRKRALLAALKARPAPPPSQRKHLPHPRPKRWPPSSSSKASSPVSSP